MSPANGGFLFFLWCFFIAFMLYPLGFVFSNAFFTDKGFTLIFFRLMLSSPTYTVVLANSVNLGLTVTLFTTLLSLPLAFLFVRYDFPGKVVLNGLILIPLVLPLSSGPLACVSCSRVLDRSIYCCFTWVSLISPSTGWAGALALWYCLKCSIFIRSCI